MNCIFDRKEGAEILQDYCAGTLDPARAVELEAHIQDCVECRRLVDAQRAVWECLDRWTPAEVSSDFDAKVYARIAQEQAGPVWMTWLRRVFQPVVPYVSPYSFWKTLIPVAAAGAVLSLALFTQAPDIGTPPTNKQGVIENAALDKIDVDQVEQSLADLDILIPISSSSSKM